jgi:hypothetical protein
VLHLMKDDEVYDTLRKTEFDIQKFSGFIPGVDEKRRGGSGRIAGISA